MSTAEVVGRYFDAIRGRDDTALRGLFADDAELVTAAGTVRGADAIADWYRDLVFGAGELEPTPGPLLRDGDRVAVEISLRIDGRTTLVADVFTLAGDRIRRLAVYLGPDATA